MDTYDALKMYFKLITGVFFREIKINGTENVPMDKPCIFIVAPHANQFVDPGLVIISNPRRFSPLMAKSSFKKKFVGTVARSLKAIPVIRPQDLAVKGIGKIVSSQEYALIGQDTQFTQQFSSRDLISLSKTVSLEVAEVVSDTELKLKTKVTEEVTCLIQESGAYKVTPHVDQSTLYEKVHERLGNNECLVIFPEGGSHDQSELLPLKAGFSIMALGAMAENKGLDVQIVPIGLNYFHPHRFRSRAVISYGTPISIKPDWVEAYSQGGQGKREAIASLLDAGYEGLKSVTVNSPSYDVLLTIAAARRLYIPAAEHKLTIDQVVELNRRFLLGYKYFEKDPRLVDLAQRIKAYNNTLKYFGLRDHQVMKTQTTAYSAAPVLFSRLLKICSLAVFGFPSLIINSPLIILIFIISQKKQEEALAGSSVKIAARDVLATWKILVTMVGMPTLYGFYSFLLFTYLYYYGYKHYLLLSFGFWTIFPLIQYICVLMLENSVDIYRSLQPLFMSLSNPDGAAELRKMRENLSETITKFVDENGSTALSDFDKTRFDTMEQHEKIESRSILSNLTMSPQMVQKWLDDRHIFSFSNSSSASNSDTEEQ